MIGTLLANIAFVLLYLDLINYYGSHGCFCDIALRDGTQARLLDVDADDILLITQSEAIDIIDVDGPTLNLMCFLVKFSYTILLHKVFGKRKRNVMNASPDGDNWRVGL